MELRVIYKFVFDLKTLLGLLITVWFFSWVFFNNLYFADSKFYYYGTHCTADEVAAATEPSGRIECHPNDVLNWAVERVGYCSGWGLQGISDCIKYTLVYLTSSYAGMIPGLFSLIGITFVALATGKGIGWRELLFFSNPYVLLIMGNHIFDALYVGAAFWLSRALIENTCWISKFWTHGLMALIGLILIACRPSNLFFAILLIYLYFHAVVLAPEDYRKRYSTLLQTVCMLGAVGMFFAVTLTYADRIIGWNHSVHSGRELFVNYRGIIEDNGLTSVISGQIVPYLRLVFGLPNVESATELTVSLIFLVTTMPMLVGQPNSLKFIVLVTDFLIFLMSPTVGAFFRYRLVIWVIVAVFGSNGKRKGAD